MTVVILKNFQKTYDPHYFQGLASFERLLLSGGRYFWGAKNVT